MRLVEFDRKKRGEVFLDQNAQSWQKNNHMLTTYEHSITSFAWADASTNTSLLDSYHLR